LTYTGAVDTVVNSSKPLHGAVYHGLHAGRIRDVDLGHMGLVIGVCGQLFAFLDHVRCRRTVDVGEKDSGYTGLGES
jgi:hypothetical protein